MGAEVVKAATIRFELGFVPELVDDEEFDDDDAPRPPQNRARRSIVWGEGVAATDGNSAQKLHEVDFIFWQLCSVSFVSMIVCTRSWRVCILILCLHSHYIVCTAFASCRQSLPRALGEWSALLRL